MDIISLLPVCYNGDEMRKRSRSTQEISWLPIDSRLLPHILSFGHVKGAARLFLQIEMVLSALVVLGVFVIVFVKLFF